MKHIPTIVLAFLLAFVPLGLGFAFAPGDPASALPQPYKVIYGMPTFDRAAGMQSATLQPENESTRPIYFLSAQAWPGGDFCGVEATVRKLQTYGMPPGSPGGAPAFHLRLRRSVTTYQAVAGLRASFTPSPTGDSRNNALVSQVDFTGSATLAYLVHEGQEMSRTELCGFAQNGGGCGILLSNLQPTTVSTPPPRWNATNVGQCISACAFSGHGPCIRICGATGHVVLEGDCFSTDGPCLVLEVGADEQWTYVDQVGVRKTGGRINRPSAITLRDCWAETTQSAEIRGINIDPASIVKIEGWSPAPGSDGKPSPYQFHFETVKQ